MNLFGLTEKKNGKCKKPVDEIIVTTAILFG